MMIRPEDYGAKGDGALYLNSVVVGVPQPDTLRLRDAATAPVSAANVAVGTDDTAAFRALSQAALPDGARIELSPGAVYLLNCNQNPVYDPWVIQNAHDVTVEWGGARLSPGRAPWEHEYVQGIIFDDLVVTLASTVKPSDPTPNFYIDCAPVWNGWPVELRNLRYPGALVTANASSSRLRLRECFFANQDQD